MENTSAPLQPSSLAQLINRWVNDPDTASDIAQDTLLKYHINRHKITSSEQGWLYQVAKNGAMDYLKSKKKLTTVGPLPEVSAAWDDKVNYNEAVINCMLTLIPTLDQKYREVLELSICHQLSQKQISEKLGLSYTSVKSRAQRARQHLLKEFLCYCNIKIDSYGNIISCVDKISPKSCVRSC